MTAKLKARVHVDLLSPQPVSEQDLLQVLLEMETQFNARPTRFRVHLNLKEVRRNGNRS